MSASVVGLRVHRWWYNEGSIVSSLASGCKTLASELETVAASLARLHGVSSASLHIQYRTILRTHQCSTSCALCNRLGCALKADTGCTLTHGTQRCMIVAIALVVMATRSASAALPAASQCRVAVCGAGVASAWAPALSGGWHVCDVLRRPAAVGGRTSSRRTDLGHFDVVTGRAGYAATEAALAVRRGRWSRGAAAQARALRHAARRPGSTTRRRRATSGRSAHERHPAPPACARRITCVYRTRVKGADFDDGWTLRDAAARTSAARRVGQLGPPRASAAGLPAPPARRHRPPESNDLPRLRGRGGQGRVEPRARADAGFAASSVRSRSTPRSSGRRRHFLYAEATRRSPTFSDSGSGPCRDRHTPERTPATAAAEEDPRAALQSKSAGARRRRVAPLLAVGPGAASSRHRRGAPLGAALSKPEGGTPPAISELGGRFVAVGDYARGAPRRVSNRSRPRPRAGCCLGLVRVGALITPRALKNTVFRRVLADVRGVAAVARDAKSSPIPGLVLFRSRGRRSTDSLVRPGSHRCHHRPASAGLRAAQSSSTAAELRCNNSPPTRAAWRRNPRRDACVTNHVSPHAIDAFAAAGARFGHR